MGSATFGSGAGPLASRHGDRQKGFLFGSRGLRVGEAAFSESVRRAAPPALRLLGAPSPPHFM
eukprot:12756577-Alexandrium_andersonii.AAC.1